MTFALRKPRTPDLPDWETANLADPDVGYRIAALLYDEAALLDERRFRNWIDWLSDDLRYLMPVRANRLPREASIELGGADEVAHYDETKTSFAVRIKRLETGMAWAEDPASRVRRFVSNVTVRSSTAYPEYVLARSYLSAYRSRVDDELGSITAARHDIWVKSDAPQGWSLRQRYIVPDDVILHIGNLSFWF